MASATLANLATGYLSNSFQNKPTCDRSHLSTWVGTGSEIRLASASSAAHTWAQVRAMAWFLVGFEAGLRVSEVCGLTVCCWVRLLNGNIELKVVQTKNNRWLSMMADRARLVRAAFGLETARRLCGL